MGLAYNLDLSLANQPPTPLLCVVVPLPNLVPGNCSRSRSCGRKVGTPPWCQSLLIKLGRTADLPPLEHGWCVLSFFIRESKEPATLPRVNPVTIVT